MHKSDYDTITDKSVELEPWFNNVYLYDIGDERKGVVFEYNDNFALLSTFHKEHLDGYRDRLEGASQNLYELLLNHRHISKLYVEYAKRCGWDYEALEKQRLSNIAEYAKEKAELEKELDLEHQKRIEAHSEQMHAVRERLKKGLVVDNKRFCKAISFFKFKVHPRTLGTIKNLNGVIGINSATKPKGMRYSTHNSIIQVAKDFIES